MGAVASVTAQKQAPLLLTQHAFLIESALRRVALPSNSLLGRMTGYHLGWLDQEGHVSPGSMGKFFRSSLCVWACEACGGHTDAALAPAVAIELIHNFTLVHDDIQDGDHLRRNRPTVWRVWGTAQAINAGDALHALAFRSLSDLSEDPARGLLISGVISEALLEVIRGQCLDLMLEGRLPTSALTYVRLIRLKTAALIGAAMEAGAVSAGATPAVRAAFRRAGQLLGLAFQLRDDWLGIWGESDITGKSNHSDLFRRKLTYPVVAAYAKAAPEQRRVLSGLYREGSPQAAMAMRRLLEELGGANLTADAAGRPAQKAVLALTNCLTDSSVVEDFSDVADYVAQRDR